MNVLDTLFLILRQVILGTEVFPWGRVGLCCGWRRRPTRTVRTLTCCWFRFVFRVGGLVRRPSLLQRHLPMTKDYDCTCGFRVGCQGLGCGVVDFVKRESPGPVEICDLTKDNTSIHLLGTRPRCRVDVTHRPYALITSVVPSESHLVWTRRTSESECYGWGPRHWGSVPCGDGPFGRYTTPVCQGTILGRPRSLESSIPDSTPY